MASDGPIRAAQYLRMSTERQDLSIGLQSVANAAYAAERGYELVREYRDEGISGLSIEKRAGLKRLIADVIGGQADFSVVLVYDVSRWGRFQNPDESAHYEFICADAGVRVEYCAEVFENDGSPTSALLKHLKRAMAAEYSRELSVKVGQALQATAEKGFHAGGRPPYGYRCVVTDREGELIPPPDGRSVARPRGSRKRLVPGSDLEVATVRRIFSDYLKLGSLTEIAHRLSEERIPSPTEGQWHKLHIARVLDNEAYLGRLVWGRYRRHLGKERKAPQSEWLIIENAFEPLVTTRQFNAVRRLRERKARMVTYDEALDDLKRLVAKNGGLSQKMLKQQGKWSLNLYDRRFGSMRKMRSLVGLPQPRRSPQRSRGSPKRYTDEQMLGPLRELFAQTGKLCSTIINAAPGVPAFATYVKHFGSIEPVYALVGYEPTERQRGTMVSGRFAPD